MMYRCISCIESKNFSILPLDYYSVRHSGQKRCFTELSELVSYMSRHCHCGSFKVTGWHRTPLKDIRLCIMFYFKVEQSRLFD